MLCWKCGQEMETAHASGWRTTKIGDRVLKETLVCWKCCTIFTGQMSEVKDNDQNILANRTA